MAQLAERTKGFSGADVAEVCHCAIKLAIGEAVEVLSKLRADQAAAAQRVRAVSSRIHTYHHHHHIRLLEVVKRNRQHTVQKIDVGIYMYMYRVAWWCSS